MFVQIGFNYEPGMVELHFPESEGTFDDVVFWDVAPYRITFTGHQNEKDVHDDPCLHVEVWGNSFFGLLSAGREKILDLRESNSISMTAVGALTRALESIIHLVAGNSDEMVWRELGGSMEYPSLAGGVFRTLSVLVEC